jgi:hypothetical protein
MAILRIECGSWMIMYSEGLANEAEKAKRLSKSQEAAVGVMVSDTLIWHFDGEWKERRKVWRIWRIWRSCSGLVFKAQP